MQYRLGLGSPQLRLGGQVVFGPIGHGIKHFTEGFTTRSQAVLHPGRGFTIGFAANHATGFEFFQSDGECSCTYTANVIHKLRKSARWVLG